MIIVSQNKEVIINFNNITNIRVLDDNKQQIIAQDLNNKNTYYLGIYVTAERTKEVLQEIIEQYEYSQGLKKDNAIFLSSENNRVYEMPKE